mgnify:CR=1 FL=1
MQYIGIDLGTSAVKLLLTDETGAILASAQADYPLHFPGPGWSEQDPADWWDQTAACLKKLIQQTDPKQIAGISVGGQMHGLVILDRNDRVIRPAILWNDNRTAVQTDWLNREIGKENLLKYTANIAFAGFTAPKLLWLRAEEPENFSAIEKIMLPKDYLTFRLTGVHCTDYSDASGTLLLDVKRRRWSQEMLGICGIEERQMPALFESYEPVGTLRAEIAEAFGLPAHVKVAAGAGDNAAAAIGTGTVGEMQCNISVGTSGTVFLTAKNCMVDPNGALHSFAHADGNFHLMGCMLSAAACNRWWMENILGTSDYDKAQKRISTERLGTNPVIFLPYLMGERSPHNDPYARGCFVGMSMDTTREDMMLAVLEGVAFGLRDNVEAAKALGVTPLSSRVCGGGAKSELWRKILANVLAMPLERVETEEGPAYGASILAATACGAFPNVKTAADRLVKVRDVIEPDAILMEKYEKKYQLFRSVYPKLKSLYRDMS